MKFIFILFLLNSILSFNCIAQDLFSLAGKVQDGKTVNPVDFATVVLKEQNNGTVTSVKGNFELSNIKRGIYTLFISCVGYKTIEEEITIEENKSGLIFNMQVLTNSLDEVIVISQESKQNGTSSFMNKDAIRHLQPSSFADILELLPGQVSVNNDMTSMKLISIREPQDAANNSEYDYNSSFGTSFVMDGLPISNDAELQNVTGSFSSQSVISDRNTTGKGVDMRTISTDNIESIEIVRGIPSVKYGDLTSGVVNIKRSYKAKPISVRMKSNPESKLLSVGKGISLGKNESLNADVDYLDYKSDPRNPKVNYSRITSSFRYANKWNKAESLIRYNGNVDYTGSFDGSKTDPEIDSPETDKYKSKYNKIGLGSSLQWFPKSISIIQNISGRFSGTYTHNQKIIDKSVVSGNTPVYKNTVEGEFYGEYLPISYLSHLVVDGKPVTFYTGLSWKLNVPVLGVNHSVLMGLDWSFDKNFGNGEVYDLDRPMYPGVGRPRAPKDIPSIQKLSWYFEDKASVSIGKSKLKIQGGVRAAQAMNISSMYKISNRFYYDPRINVNLYFHEISMFKRKFKFAVNGGFGMHTKFPGLDHLYPNLLYIDKVQLNYFSQNESLRQIQYKTKIVDQTNYQLAPNRNEKIELGFNVSSGDIHFDLTFYHEMLKNGFKYLSHYEVMNYKLYDISSGPLPSELNAPPTVEMFDYENKYEFITYSKRVNGAREEKFGIEYQLDLGRLELLKSRVSINGAWMRANYDLSEPSYRHPSVIINDQDYPYVGYYNWNQGKEYEQFNTNFRFDTQIDEYGLIFSTSVQCMWYMKYKYNSHNGMPDYYIDYTGKISPYTIEETNDPILKFLYEKPSPNEFDTDRKAIGIDVNLTVSKIISEHIELSFYVNRILDYYPDYTSKSGNKVKRKVSPYFGMELNINL